MNWEKADEYEELFTPNQKLTANIIYLRKIRKLNNYWDKAYKHYCEYQGDPNQCITFILERLI